MARNNKYTLQDLQRHFPTDDDCLSFIFDANHNKRCLCGGQYSPVRGRKQYQCSRCRFQVAPLAGTIFHKSSTPLTIWFYAIFVFSNAKSGISAKELERQIGVTYKCAYRILKQIRKALSQNDDKLDGDVEFDLGYFGGRDRAGRGNKRKSHVIANKKIVMAAIERGGNMKVEVVKSAGKIMHQDFFKRNIAESATLLTDGGTAIRGASKDRKRKEVIHSKGEYARGYVHINTVESFFGHVKRSLRGTYKTISKKELQSYLDAFAFHYNNRHSDTERFAILLGKLLHA